MEGREERERKQASGKWRRASAKIAEALANDACEKRLLDFCPQLGVKKKAVLLSIRDGGTTDQLGASIRSGDSKKECACKAIHCAEGVWI